MSRLGKNILYNLFGQGLVLILGFVAVKYIFKQLGEDALGVIYFTLTMNAVLCAALEMGITSTTVREVSAHFHDEPGYIRDLIRTASAFYWSVYGVLALMIYLMAPLLVEKWINLSTLDADTAVRVFRILGISALVALPRSLYASLFRGLQRMEFNNLIDVITSALQQFGTAVILAFGGSLFMVVDWFALCFVIGLVLYLFVSARFFSWSVLVPGLSSAVIRRNLGFSSHLMSISILAVIHTHADKVITSKLLPIGTFGFYGFAAGVVSRVTLVTGAIAQAAFPSFSLLHKQGDRAGLMAQYRKLQDLLCYTTVPLFAAVPFSALPLLTYLFNREVAHMLLVPISFLSAGYYMNGTLNVPYFFSLAVGKPEIMTLSNFLALLIVLPVTVLLIQYFGLAGAGFSWVFYHLFAYAYAVPKICSQCLRIPVSEWYRHILKIWGLVGLTYGVAWLLMAWAGAYTIQGAALSYTLASAAFLIGANRMMNRDLRRTLSGMVRKLYGNHAEAA